MKFKVIIKFYNKILPLKHLNKALAPDQASRDKFQLGFFAKSLFQAFEKIGVAEENIYAWLLEKSYNNKNVRIYTAQIMEPYQHDILL